MEFAGLKSFRSEASPRTQAGERIYAIGDVHGRYDLLRELLDRIGRHSDGLPFTKTTHLLLLGDLVDRGPESARVLRFVHGVQQRSMRMIVLMGNHEELMLKALEGAPGMFRAWRNIGGSATIRSFGLEPPADRDADPREFLEQLRATIPQELLSWMRKLPLTARSGDYLFCHAGIRPQVPLKKQTRADLLWIRDEFLTDESSHGMVVVHGHSVATDVEMRPNRIGIDTGAYRSGVLTALYLEDDKREIISTGR